MSVDTLLSRLQGVKKTGDGRRISLCPAHGDKHPSLSVRELDDGRVLVHCFGGCSVESVLDAVGLEFDALFPPKPIDFAKPERRPFLASDLFEIVRLEVGVVAVVAADMHANRTVSDADYDRIFLTVERLNEIAGAAYGR